MKVSRQLAATLCLAMVLFSGGCSVYQSQRMEPGNMAVLVQAPRTGLRTFEDALEAGPNRG